MGGDAAVGFEVRVTAVSRRLRPTLWQAARAAAKTNGAGTTGEQQTARRARGHSSGRRRAARGEGGDVAARVTLSVDGAGGGQAQTNAPAGAAAARKGLLTEAGSERTRPWCQPAAAAALPPCIILTLGHHTSTVQPSRAIPCMGEGKADSRIVTQCHTSPGPRDILSDLLTPDTTRAATECIPRYLATRAMLNSEHLLWVLLSLAQEWGPTPGLDPVGTEHKTDPNHPSSRKRALTPGQCGRQSTPNDMPPTSAAG
ncbi:hypothetical protein P154DRAFT_533699 [Amniculicola lignicola CBS 123094]|uniref:Uncharacterized protein n=1 Tax=Amniculicola lignicola CBS 123094 TaxID=1392246 RepID=A0A6A5WM35_9PLEO|nr:hypothetical protein P154DRAFT_533699 [Amniculicola lignicola CBS 123094]